MKNNRLLLQCNNIQDVGINVGRCRFIPDYINLYQKTCWQNVGILPVQPK